ncbi:MAG: DUF1552 domain-containing protein [Bryobacterales bacterium]
MSGLACHQGNALGDGAGDHARAASSYLTGVHLAQNRRRGHPLRALDGPVYAAWRISRRKHGRPRSRSPAKTAGRSASCDSYSCVYQSISWKSETQPMPPEMNPRMAFERPFGDASLDAAAAPNARERVSTMCARKSRWCASWGRKTGASLTSI